MTESAGQPPLLRLALISCGKAKLDHAAPARDLYTGGLFRAAVRHAEAEYDDYRVLSAKWHLLRPDRVIEPYDVSMADLTASQRAVWGEVVSAQAICAWLPLRTRRRIVIDVFAGQTYVDALPTRWTRGSPGEPTVELRVPHEGMQIGERLHAFAVARDGAAHPS